MRNVHTPRSSTKDPPPTMSSSSTAKIPYDRNNPNASSSSRSQPQPPSLAKRTPIVPKLAVKPTPSPASLRQTLTLATPATRRAAVRSESALSGHGSAVGHGVNYNSPAAKFAQQHVTPRSGSRQNRLSSANTSPNPSEATVDNWDSRSGLGISASNLEPPRSTPSVNRDSKFFYASDATKGAPSPAPQRPALQRAPTSQPKAPTFFYANGNNLPATNSTPNVAPPPLLSPLLAASTPDPMASKFMYANGTPDLKPSLMNSASGGSVVSTSSRAPSTRAGSGPSLAPIAQRVPSPPKPTSQPHSQSDSLPGPTLADRRSVPASAPHLGQNGQHMRRISTEPPPRKMSGHSRSGSLVAEASSVNRIMAASPTNISPLPSPLIFKNPGLSMASVLEAADSMEDHDDSESMSDSELTSPKSSTGSGSDPLTELVANARREREMQDLQITNGSLEAINRTLERQLRKQTNELRRFKRLSRAGRLSSANTAASSRATSGSTVSEAPEGPLNRLDLSDLSEEDSDPDLREEEEGDLESEMSESDSTGSDRAASPITMASRDVRHRRQDEKRLQVDLSKHRQLLVDSQKMNQSIKRCLGWTEELISEGRRALAYQVRVSEEDMSGRVAPEDGEKAYVYDGAALWEHQDEDHHSDASAAEEEESDDGEDVDADDTMRLRIERLRPVDESSGNKNAQDRDSGIVLAGDAA